MAALVLPRARIKRVVPDALGLTPPVWRLAVPTGFIRNNEVWDEDSPAAYDVLVWVGSFETQAEAQNFLNRPVADVFRTYSEPRSRAEILQAIYKGQNIDNNGW